MLHQVKITISGVTASGKTLFLRLLAGFLREKGVGGLKVRCPDGDYAQAFPEDMVGPLLNERHVVIAMPSDSPPAPEHELPTYHVLLEEAQALRDGRRTFTLTEVVDVLQLIQGLGWNASGDAPVDKEVRRRAERIVRLAKEES